MDQQGIAYYRYYNTFTRIDDLEAAQSFCEKFAHYDWPPLLPALAARVNPILNLIQTAGFGSSYWVADQGELATDILFQDRASLEVLLPDLFEHAILQGASTDILRFLGHNLYGNFRGEVTTSLKKRPEGWRAKHSMKRNSIKRYDKSSVLRVETTINNPSKIKICRQTEDGKLRWTPMGKRVSNLYRYAEVGQQANHRYLEHLAQANLKSKALPHLDDLYRSHTQDGKRFTRFNPLQDDDRNLFAAILSGEFTLSGFRNRDLCGKLYAQPAASDAEGKQRWARSSRLIANLCGHVLVAKVKDARLYRITKLGSQVLFAVLCFYKIDFPIAFQSAQ